MSHITFEMKFLLYLYCSLFAGAVVALAQDRAEPLDPAGYLTKYDVDFDGVGPEVYVLPTPRHQPKRDLLVESYQAKADFEAEINWALDVQHFLAEFRQVGNADYLDRWVFGGTPDAQQWDTMVAQELGRKNYTGAYSILHLQAFRSLKTGAFDRGLELLLGALQQAQKTRNDADIATIRYNLANLYLLRNNVEQAGAFLADAHASAVRRADIIEQGNTLIKQALVQARAGDYASAEDNIIHRAIPIFNKIEAHDRKVIAWLTLAKIYRSHRLHTEAQWFLLQARELAESHNFRTDLAEIEYLLALSKISQRNYPMAEREFIHANKMADAEGNKMLQLAILDKLGQVYLAENKRDKAQRILTEYQNLRNFLFPKQQIAFNL